MNGDYQDAFEQRLANIPLEWRAHLVDVMDTFDAIKIKLAVEEIQDNFLLLELTRLVVERHDKQMERKQNDD